MFAYYVRLAVLSLRRNPVLTALRYFRSEFEDHVLRKRCPATACKEIISAPCIHTCQAKHK